MLRSSVCHFSRLRVEDVMTAEVAFPNSRARVGKFAVIAQQIGKRAMFMLGRINMVDMYDLGREFSGGRGAEQFQHLEFTAPFSGITPPMIFGGIASVQTAPAKFTLMIYDPANRTQQTGFEDLAFHLRAVEPRSRPDRYRLLRACSSCRRLQLTQGSIYV